MSIPHLPRREFLSVFTASTLGLLGARGAGSSAGRRAFSRLDVGPPKNRENRARFEARAVEEVCRTLALELASLGRPLTADQLRITVHACYARVYESAMPPQYLWVLIDGEWVLWCFGTTTFLVDQGRDGDVLITLQEWQPLS